MLVNIKTKEQKPYQLIEQLKNESNLLFDDRFRGTDFGLVRFNNQYEMAMFRKEVIQMSEDCLMWINHHGL